ncbi:MAG: hypothetical protein H6559_24745 [Lewinellaceae bacterium]|nr:hypothetical protein [Lewinellaceae bacterium]
MVDLKSFVFGGFIVLIGVYWAIQKRIKEGPRVERRVIVFKNGKKRKTPTFSDN